MKNHRLRLGRTLASLALALALATPTAALLQPATAQMA